MPSSKKKSSRKPRQKQNPVAVSKNPRSTPSSVNSKNFRWNTENADLEGEYGWSKIELKALLNEVIPRLQKYETMTWGEIEGKESHFIDVDNCSKEAQKRLKEIKLDDVEQLFSLRIGSRKRIFGWRKEAIFYVLWWDPDHKIYLSKIKHT
ncbi:MAG: hypothetical protein OXF23_03365 [Candidatus Dadabacteria bacterium]|nr:hypothetical protein [Candidatus Dadabacteria bacterium]